MRELHHKCGLPPEDCRAALEGRGGHMDAALARLIDKGKVTVDQLDPDTVSDELFARAQKMAYIEVARKLGRKVGGRVLGWVGAHFVGIYLRAKGRSGDANEGKMARLMQKVSRRTERLKAHPVTFDLPPLPTLKLGLHSWKGRDTLKTWAGFQSRSGPYTSRSSARPSTGAVTFEIPRPPHDQDDANPRPPAPEYAAAYAHLKDHEDEVTEAVLGAVLKYYQELRREWAGDVADLPAIEDAAALKQHIGLGNLHILPVARDGHAYLGFELGCTWDEEHGAGVLVHKSRVVDVGQADTSFDEHLALKDGGMQIT